MENAIDRTGGARRMWPVVVLPLLLVALAAALLCGWWVASQPAGDTGSRVYPLGDMTEEEARAMLDRQTDASRITVSLRPKPELADGKLHVNFLVPSGNNSFAERLEVVQDGACVYRSGVVEPEHAVTWGDAPGAHPGSATATVYAVDGSGNDFGNPVSVEVEIVEG